MLSSDKIRVGVLRGGPSPEYLVSLETGKNVLQNLPEEHYHPVDIFISRSGDWHESGLVRQPAQILRNIDVVWNGLHGAYGEDGTVQKILEDFHIPFTGSDSFSSALGMNKIMSKKVYQDYGLKTPFSVSIPFESISRRAMRDVYEQVPAPWVVKPSTAGSSVGVRIVHSMPELEEAIIAAYEYSPQVLIEEFIKGQEATCGVIDDFRGKANYSLLPIEIRPKSGFFNYDSKYSDQADIAAEEICPGNFSSAEKEMIQNVAMIAHQGLGLSHYSRSDFRVHPKRGVFILETNTLPGLTKNSLIPKSLEAIGAKFSDFLHHIIQSALQGK